MTSIRGINAEIGRIKQLSERELQDQTEQRASWHEKYNDSAYLYVGNLDRGLTEGDLITVFSQFGEIMDVNLVRDKETGKSKGFGFIAYENQLSTRYAIDNMIGFNLVGRPLKVDHVSSYRAPIVEDPEGKTDADGNPIYVDYKATGAEGKGFGVTSVTESQKMLDRMAETRSRMTARKDKKWMVEDPSVKSKKEKKEKRHHHHHHKKERSSKGVESKAESSTARRVIKEEGDDYRRHGSRRDEKEDSRRESPDRVHRRRHRSRSGDGDREAAVQADRGEEGRGAMIEGGGATANVTIFSTLSVVFSEDKMSADKKRARPSKVVGAREDSASSIDSSSSSSLSSDRESVDAGSSTEDGFDAAFRFEDMTDGDYQGVRMMITRLLDGKEYDVGSLAQCIIDQQNIGTIIKSGGDDGKKGGEDDDTAFCAVATILNPSELNALHVNAAAVWLRDKAQYMKDTKGMKQLVDHLKQQVDKHADSDDTKVAFDKMVVSDNGACCCCGIVVNERMINLPSELVPGIHRVLKDDVAWSLSEEAHCPAQERKYYKFTHLLFLSSYYVDPSSSSISSAAAMAGGKKKKAAKRKKLMLEMEKKDRRYIAFEDEVFIDHAIWQVSWPFPQGDGIDPETRKKLSRKRLLYCVKYNDWKAMVEQLG
ncbi:hypothetical protein FOL47_004091 [Perkinsus chesapeaki]|uniref:RRM domain-containing protein n=1 Tax=Perkinsus chesapeaki TaxID=330153 RepID=A0A7J6M4B5_PERCH|nr:hypothetical protein FOL47_004091 [Perkinsus chesapeaki]